MALQAVRAAMRFIASAKRGADSPRVVDGPPRIDVGSGLLLSAPHHSWIDTRSQSVEYAGYRFDRLPNRVSAKFVKDLYDTVPAKSETGALLSSPCFFLPEINAQWISVLRGTLQMLEWIIGDETPEDKLKLEAFRLELSSLVAQAERFFKPIFLNDNCGFIYNIVYQDRETRDDLESEPGVVAAAILGNTLFSAAELERVWSWTESKLLVGRRLVRFGDDILPFGLLAKNEDKRIFYSDDQYHSDVVWMRSTPYLIRLLRLLGREDTARQLVINTLDHEISEGAIFFNNELFSRPCGNNVRPDLDTQWNPVPVKNPIQFWSQWCDAVIDFPVRKEPWG